MFHQGVLENLGAANEPVVLGHSLDQHVFGEGGGLVVGAEAFNKRVEFGLLFVWLDPELARKSVPEIVHAGIGFSFGGFRSGRELGILSIRFDLGSSGHEVSLKCESQARGLAF